MMNEQVSNQWFDWEDVGGKGIELGNHCNPCHETIGKTFGDNCLDWDGFDKTENCRMKGMEDKMEAQGLA